MKAVLISIQPKWCELIASGKKTIEVRKTVPALGEAFKVYIYCTRGKFEPHEHLRSNLHYDDSVILVSEGQGKVIGEFICRKRSYISSRIDDSGEKHLENTAFLERAMCLSDHELFDYLYKGKGKDNGGWAWHIDNLVLYNGTPRPLSEFSKYGFGEPVPLKRPPQSWMYVEDGICP